MGTRTKTETKCENDESISKMNIKTGESSEQNQFKQDKNVSGCSLTINSVEHINNFVKVFDSCLFIHYSKDYNKNFKHLEDIVCQICNDGDYEDNNLIVLCSVRIYINIFF
jgi:hypothetical protein